MRQAQGHGVIGRAVAPEPLAREPAGRRSRAAPRSPRGEGPRNQTARPFRAIPPRGRHATVRAMPSSRSTLGAYPRSRRAFSMRERPALRPEVHATSVQRRLDPQGHADAPRRGPPPTAAAPPGCGRAAPGLRLPRDEAGQLGLRHVARARDEEGLAHRLRPLERQQEALEQVVDVDRVIERPARADDRVPPARDRPEELQEARLARPVDRAGPHDRHRQAATAVEVEGQRLGLRLRGLVHVAGRDGRGLVGRRMLDVAVDAHRGGVDEPRQAPRAPRPRAAPRSRRRSRRGSRSRDGRRCDRPRPRG